MFDRTLTAGYFLLHLKRCRQTSLIYLLASFTGGTPFEGSAVIKVINKGGKK